MSKPTTVFDAARRAVCLDAAYELEALALALPGLVPKEVDGVHFVVRGIAARLVQLSGVVMAGLGDEAESTASLRGKVEGGAA
jgi:hypothetical protein